MDAIPVCRYGLLFAQVRTGYMADTWEIAKRMGLRSSWTWLGAVSRIRRWRIGGCFWSFDLCAEALVEQGCNVTFSEALANVSFDRRPDRQ